MGQSKEVKQQHAAELRGESDKLTPDQKVAGLDKKLGKDKGATKERKRMDKLIKGGFGSVPFGTIEK